VVSVQASVKPESGAVDVESLEVNRRGGLSRKQRTFVYRLGIRWVINTMFVTAFGFLVVFAVGNFWFHAVGFVLVALVATYLVLRSLDYIVDSSDQRVAVVTGRVTPIPVAAIGLPDLDWKEHGWFHATVHGLAFWLPPEAMNVTKEISVYFVPRSRVVVNVEFAPSTVPD
jgi:hypothetical protein